MASIIDEKHDDRVPTRILDAAVEIVLLNTQLTRELGRHIVEKSASLARAQRNGSTTTTAAPASESSTFPLIGAFFHCIANELGLRGVPEEDVETTIADLNELYRGLSIRPSTH